VAKLCVYFYIYGLGKLGNTIFLYRPHFFSSLCLLSAGQASLAQGNNNLLLRKSETEGFIVLHILFLANMLRCYKDCLESLSIAESIIKQALQYPYA